MSENPPRSTEATRVLSQPLVSHLTRTLEVRPPHEIAVQGGARRAAVALLLRQAAEPGSLEMLLIRRAAWQGDPWSGHIALPGGRQEAGEALVDTVVRETREETAIDLARVGRILGRLDDLEPRTIVLPQIVITPFVAVMLGEADIVTSAEVAEAFWVPLAALRDPGASRDVMIDLPGGPRRLPAFLHEGHVVWGLTERILRQFLAVIEPE